MVNRESNFFRSDYTKVDETEVFKGGENSLSMTQSYTHEFQCVYQLEKYPFDTQVLTVGNTKYNRFWSLSLSYKLRINFGVISNG